MLSLVVLTYQHISFCWRFHPRHSGKYYSWTCCCTLLFFLLPTLSEIVKCHFYHWILFKPFSDALQCENIGLSSNSLNEDIPQSPRTILIRNFRLVRLISHFAAMGSPNFKFRTNSNTTNYLVMFVFDILHYAYVYLDIFVYLDFKTCLCWLMECCYCAEVHLRYLWEHYLQN